MSFLSSVKKLWAPAIDTNPEYMREGCYEIAYHIIPRTIFRKSGAFDELWSKKKVAIGGFFYEFWCAATQRESVPNIKSQFRVHADMIGEWSCAIIEYPRFSQQLANLDDEPVDTSKLPIPVPYYSAIMRHERSLETKYMLLGCSIADGATTLRSVSADGSNNNLGRGPEPTLAAFMTVLRNGLRGTGQTKKAGPQY